MDWFYFFEEVILILSFGIPNWSSKN